jgi:hypothetical protein
MARDSKTARHCGDHRFGSHPATRTWPTARDRIAEIGEILALGLIRMRARKSSPFLPTSGEISLDLNAQRSGPDRKYCSENRP